MSNLDELKTKLAGMKPKAVIAVENRKIVSKEETKKPDGRRNNKGHPGSGRKPSQAKLVKKGIQEWIDAHMHEKVDVELLGKDGKLKTMKMSRLTGALAKLYQLGMQNEGDADALNKWLDRMLGKAAQVVKGDADEPIRLLIDF